MANNESPNALNLLVGKGVIYLDRLTAAGVSTGQRHLGNCEALEIGVEDDKLQKFSSQDANARLLASVNTRRKASVKITGNEVNAQNMALFLMGDVSALALGGGAVTGEVLTTSSVQGRWYPCLGRGLTSVVVDDDTVAATITTDYLLDLVRGRVYVVIGGGIADGSTLDIDYTGAADTSATVRGAISESVIASLLYVSDPAQGPDQEIDIWKVSFSPEGVMAFINDDYAEWSLQGEILEDATHTGEEMMRIIYP